MSNFAVPDTAPCLLCGKDSEDAYEYDQMGGHQVCSTCACHVANHWYKKCSGQWLTWANEPIEKRGFQKKPIPEPLRWQVFQRDGFKCLHCGSQSHLRADHIKPESRGGEATLENLQTLCHSCNSKKGARQ